jgi:hypothetical protein
MARQFASASSQYLEVASALVSAAPFSFGCWYKPTAVGAAQTVFAVATAGSADNHWKLDLAASGVVRFRARTTGSSDALTVGTLSAGAWHFVGCRAVSATERSVFLNSEKVNNTTSRAPAGMNRTALGRSPESAGTSYANGVIAYPALWSVGLSDADFAALARATHPSRVRPAALVEWWDLTGVSPEPGPHARNEPAVTGATKADNARIFR